MNTHKLVVISLIMTCSCIFGQDSTVVVPSKKIYLQSSIWGKRYFNYKEKKMPVGKYYSNLLPIMKDRPDAYLELKEGICILSNNRPYGYTILFLSFASDFYIDIFEPQDDDLIRSATYPLFIVGLIYVISKELKGLKKIEKAISIFNSD
ncbi:hypothetical protein JYT44_03440 [Caldithrix abyssi]|nr:hypothetical protein [Caldithrix abyssi]